MRQQLHGLGDFFSAIDHQTLPTQGGLFFVKGGYTNIFGMTPTDPDSKVQKNFLGDDDHPAYSDAQISVMVLESMINTLPAAWSTGGCAYLGITTTDRALGISNLIPPDFNPRPKTNPN